MLTLGADAAFDHVGGSGRRSIHHDLVYPVPVTDALRRSALATISPGALFGQADGRALIVA